MRKDILAAGGHKATYGVSGHAGDEIILKNVAPEEERNDAVPEMVKVSAPKKRFIPLENVLLVRRAEAQSLSGILITETMEQEQPAEGTILAAGANEVGLRQGDYIVFGKYAGAQFKLNGEVLLLMNVDEVKGKLEDSVPEVPRDHDWAVPPCSAIGRA